MAHASGKLPLKEVGRALPAQIAIDALIIDVKRTGDVFAEFICYICHNMSVKSFLSAAPLTGFAERIKLHARKHLRDWGE